MVRKAVILAGGMGTRLAEETEFRPKPLVEIGGRPILWHIMKIYSSFGINEFIICLGYKGYAIKEYFANYYLHMADVTFNLADNSMEVHRGRAESWKVTLVDTGLETMTGGRVRRVRDYIGNEPFCLTYGDGVADVDVGRLIEHHITNRRLATVTAVRPPGRFGALEIENSRVSNFREKPLGDGGWINGGFFVMEPGAIDYIEADHLPLENEPLTNLAADQQLTAFHHDGFWHPMDTIRDRTHLEKLWATGEAPWKRW